MCMLLTQPMMQPEAHCKIIRHYVSMTTIPTVRRLVSTNENSLRKLLISMSLQNMVHGLPTTKLEFQAVRLIWIPVRQQKKQPSKTVNKVVVMHHVKWLFGFGMVALPLLKASLVKNGLPFPAQKNPVLRRLMHYDNVEHLAALNVLSLRTKAAQCRNTDIIRYDSRSSEPLSAARFRFQLL